MEITISEIDLSEYKEYMRNYIPDVFMLPEFNSMNSGKVNELLSLIFRCDNDVFAGLIAGVKDGVLYCPFSAPYSGIIFKYVPAELSFVLMAKAFQEYLKKKGLKATITFPAQLDDSRFVQNNRYFEEALISEGFKIAYKDLNYHLKLPCGAMDPNVRRRIRKAQNEGYEFVAEDFSPKGIVEAYSVISRNRDVLGYQLSMSIDDFLQTSRIIEIKLFKVRKNNECVGAAICYITRANIMQVISWGDKVEHRKNLSVMPFLVSGLYSWMECQRSIIDVIDLGPASKYGFVSNGLAAFKASIGGIESYKSTLQFGF